MARSARRLADEELQSFASLAGHDMQEPLRKMLAFGDRLRSEYAEVLGPKGQDYLQRMGRAAGRMQCFILGLLEYSRVTSRAQPFEPVPLGAAVGRAMDQLRRDITDSHASIEVLPLPTIEADPAQMAQLFTRLMDNSLKFRGPAAPLVRVCAGEADDARCTLLVEDNGIGFDPEQAENIFKPFVRLNGRSQYEGAGMGLAVCRKIVERHGGTLVAHGEPGAGARFVIGLPLSQPAGPLADEVLEALTPGGAA